MNPDTPMLYLARTAHDYDATGEFHGVAFTPEGARDLAEASLTDNEKATLKPWGEPDEDGEQWARFGTETMLEVIPVPLVGAQLVEEWRVTGQPAPLPNGTTFPYYRHQWTEAVVERHGGDYGDTPEKAARGFAAMVRARANQQWDEGPDVSSRIVVRTDWTQDADA